jgi:hypothetical protein
MIKIIDTEEPVWNINGFICRCGLNIRAFDTKVLTAKIGGLFSDS